MRSSSYRVKIYVKEVKGYCAMGYEPGDYFLVEKYYIKDAGKGVCLHALAAMLTLLSPFLKGMSAQALGVGWEDDVGYMCSAQTLGALYARWDGDF